LALFVFGIFTNHHHATTTLDHAALFANFLNWGSDFHKTLWYVGNSVTKRAERDGSTWLTSHESCGFNRLEYFVITALESRNSGYFCDVLSTGQLPIQISQLCTHNVLLQRASHFWGNVSWCYGTLRERQCFKSFL